METLHSSEWEQAWRYCLLIEEDNKVALHSMTKAGTRDLFSLRHPKPLSTSNAAAVCRVDRAHNAPELGCSCGLYAVRDLRDLPKTFTPNFSAVPHSVLCQVELAGKIVEGSIGFRAQRMRVQKVVLPEICSICKKNPTAGVHKFRRHLRPSCAKCASGSLIGLPQLQQHLGTEVATASNDPQRELFRKTLRGALVGRLAAFAAIWVLASIAFLSIFSIFTMLTAAEEPLNVPAGLAEQLDTLELSHPNPQDILRTLEGIAENPSILLTPTSRTIYLTYDGQCVRVEVPSDSPKEIFVTNTHHCEPIP